MTAEHATHPDAPSPFSADEQAAFKADDIKAAANIVKLMVGIFTMGLIGYLIVCWAIVA